MISPSRRRRRSALSPDAAFQIHLRLARRKELHRRLVRASLLAVVVAAALLFAPVSSTWHALFTALAFGLGAALPLRGSKAAALEEIRAYAGFGYDTALDLLAATGSATGSATESGTDNDPYGFAAAVTQRARLTMRGFQARPQAAWWLPATLMALTLVLLPGLLPGVSAFGGGAGPGSGGSGAAPPGFEGPLGSQEEEEDDNAGPQPEAPGRVDDGADGSGVDSAPDSEAVPPLPDDGSGQAPLARYLESLRERPASTGGAVTRGSAQQAQDAPGESDADSERAAGSQTVAAPPRDAATASDEAGRQESAAGEAAPDGSGNGTTRAQDDEDGATGQDGADEQGQEAGASEQADAQQGDDQRLSEDGGSEQGAGTEQGGSERDSGADRASGASGDVPGSDDGSDDAGRSGAESSGEPTTIDLSNGSPELLSGVLGDGPESSAGTVRLPGSDEVQLPSGTSIAPYRSAAEEALTEGDLPLEYQEIIRRYFR